MKTTNDEGPTVAAVGLQGQTKTDPAIVADHGTAGKTRHPLSAAFGDMPADDFAELVADIKRNHLVSAIATAGDGSILDGWHRYKACIAAGVKPRFEPVSYIIEPAAEGAGRTMTEAEFVIAQNAHRRHLTPEQRRRIVAELLKADPAKSDRAIGSMAKVDHKTVATVRRQAEAGGEIPHHFERIGRDGKKQCKPAGQALEAKVKRVVAAADDHLRSMEGKPHKVRPDVVDVVARVVPDEVAPQATAAPDAKVQPEPPPDISPEREAELNEQLAAAVTSLRESEAQSAAIKASVRGTPAPQGAWAEVLGQLGAIAEAAARIQESFGDRLQPLPMPVGDMHAKLHARMAQMAASIAKLSEHVGQTFLNVDVPAPKAAGGRISEVIVTHGKQSVSVDAHLLRQIADALLKEGRKNAAHISGAFIQEAAGHLKQLVTKGHTNLIELARNELDREVRAEFDRRHPELLAEARQKQEKLSDEIHLWKERNKGTDDYMTQDEFRLLQGCLHPDRQPEAEKEKYGRAFQIIKRMESRIDPSKRKRMTKGWA